MSGQGCYLCPRACGVDRRVAVGYCGAGDKARIAKVVDPFYYEEPCLGKLGAVFFGGCSLGCSYCQNVVISRVAAGEEYDDGYLAQLMEGIAGAGRAVDLVTPTHFSVNIARAASMCKTPPRLIYNTSGYETARGVELAAEYTSVFLTDFKYGDSGVAARLSRASDYPTVAVEALQKMRALVPDEWEEDEAGNRVLRRGLVVRHLVLPGEVKNSIAALDMIKSAIGTDVVVSLMSQFTPNGVGAPRARLKKIEYKIVCEHADKLGFDKGYIQHFDSASSEYTPTFE